MKTKSFFPLHNRTAVAVALTFMINAIMYGSWIARLPDIRTRLNLSEGEVGIALMGIAVGSLFGTPMTAFILQKIKTGQATFRSILFLCFCFSLPALAWGKWSLAILLTILGLSTGFMNISMNNAATALEEKEKINILSTCHGMFSVGLVIGAASSGWVSSTGFDFFWHIVVVAILMCLLAFILRKDLLKVPETTSEEAGFVFPPKAVLGLGIICACFNIGEGAIADWSAIYLRDILGSNEFVASLGLAIFSTGMAIGRFSGDKIRKLFISRQILITGGLVTLAGLLTVISVSVEYLAIFGFFLAGLGLSFAVPVLYSESTKVPGVKSSVGLASVATFSIVGFMSGPPLIGFISEEIGLKGGFGFVASLAAIGITLVFIRLK